VLLLKVTHLNKIQKNGFLQSNQYYSHNFPDIHVNTYTSNTLQTYFVHSLIIGLEFTHKCARCPQENKTDIIKLLDL